VLQGPDYKEKNTLDRRGEHWHVGGILLPPFGRSMSRKMGDVVVVPKQNKKNPRNEGFAMRGVHFRRNIWEKKIKMKKKVPARFLRSLAAVFVIADILILAVLVVAAVAFILGSVGFVAALIPVFESFSGSRRGLGWGGGYLRA
jgi:hypothetical protein